MRYYVEINGISSLTLTGFAIKELPPISKPPIRTQKDEIDGRDGDIITKLGYGAYDKQIEVGLYGNDYDINEIISFFNSEGIITFSNEPDKYYNFTIVNQIDFEKLLKFKTATITFHCQPFKYKKDEEPIEVEYQYIEGEGTEITLENTDDQPLKMELFGNTSQQTYTGKNILHLPNGSVTDHDITGIVSDNCLLSYSGTASGAWANITDTTTATIPAGTYTFSIDKATTGGERIVLYTMGATNQNFIIWQGNTSVTVTLNDDKTSYRVGLTNTNTNTSYNGTFKMQLESGSSATSFEPYVGGQAAPNPQYPQDIHVVSGDNSILMRGRNLWDEDWHLGGIGAAGADYNGTTTSIRTQSYTEIGENKSFFVTCPLGDRCYVFYYDKNQTFLSSTTIWFNASHYATGTTPNNTKYLRIVFISTYGTTYNNDIIIGYYSNGVDTTYEPYNGNTYEIDLRIGKNLFDINTIVKGYELNANTGKDQENANWWLSDYIAIKPNTDYTSSNISSNTKCWYDKYKNFISRVQSVTGTSPANAKYLRVNGTISSIESEPNAMIEEGNSATTFEAYNSIELCKIPDTNYIDGFEYDIDENKWYLHKEIEKYVFNGSESFAFIERTGVNVFVNNAALRDLIHKSANEINIISDYFLGTMDNQGNVANSIRSNNSGQVFITIPNTNPISASTSAFTTWLSSNNVPTHYILATSTNREVEYQPLIEQLNALLEVIAKKGQTNISQINNDLPFYIKATTRELGSDTATIINEGNIYSKPILNVIGEGNVGVSLNGNQIFNLDLSDPNAVTIDPNKLEAYNPNSLDLMNRKVVGDIANLKLPEGTNEMKFDGALTKATITNYSRWL